MTQFEKDKQADMLELGKVLYSMLTGDKRSKLLGDLPEWVDSDLRFIFENLKKEASERMSSLQVKNYRLSNIMSQMITLGKKINRVANERNVPEDPETLMRWANYNFDSAVRQVIENLERTNIELSQALKVKATEIKRPPTDTKEESKHPVEQAA
jgi:hypothetical protein